MVWIMKTAAFILAWTVTVRSSAQRIYKDNVREGYFDCATLVPTTETVKVEKGYINMAIILEFKVKNSD